MALIDDKMLKAISAFRASTPQQDQAYQKFKDAVFNEEVFDKKTQELMAVCAAAAIQCKYCLEHHGKAAKKAGATQREISTAIHIATIVKAGATQMYGVGALQE